LKNALAKSEITKEASVHTLRHCFATHLLEAGVNVYSIQKLMGHTSVKTTSLYLHISGRDLARIISPLDLWEDPPEPTL
jgi:site-specific recombinase XerD